MNVTGQGTGLSLSLCYDIIETQGGVPIAIGMKVETPSDQVIRAGLPGDEAGKECE